MNTVIDTSIDTDIMNNARLVIDDYFDLCYSLNNDCSSNELSTAIAGIDQHRRYAAAHSVLTELMRAQFHDVANHLQRIVLCHWFRKMESEDNIDID